MSQGWIYLHRKICDNWIWQESKPFSYAQAWIDLLLKANHKKGYIRVRNNIQIEIKRGQIGWSQTKLAQEWGWGRTAVRTFLNRLEIEQQIKQQKNNITSVVTIINYELYQKIDSKITRSRTAAVPQPYRSRTLTKNDKECKGMTTKEKEESPLLQIFNHWNKYKGASVVKNRDGTQVKVTWRSHTLKPDSTISADIESAIKQALTKFSVEQVCKAIDNYSLVLLSLDYFWSYSWNLTEFLTRGEEPHKQAPRKFYRFLPDNFDEKRFLTEPARRRREAKEQGPNLIDIVKQQTQKEKTKNEQQQTAG